VRAGVGADAADAVEDDPQPVAARRPVEQVQLVDHDRAQAGEQPRARGQQRVGRLGRRDEHGGGARWLQRRHVAGAQAEREVQGVQRGGQSRRQVISQRPRRHEVQDGQAIRPGCAVALDQRGQHGGGFAGRRGRRDDDVRAVEQGRHRGELGRREVAVPREESGPRARQPLFERQPRRQVRHCF